MTVKPCLWKAIGSSVSKQMTSNEHREKLEKIHFKLQSLSIIWKLLQCTQLTIHFTNINVCPPKAELTIKRKIHQDLQDLLRPTSWKLGGSYGEIAFDLLHFCLFATDQPLGQDAKGQDTMACCNLYYGFVLFSFSPSTTSFSMIFFFFSIRLYRFATPSREDTL